MVATIKAIVQKAIAVDEKIESNTDATAEDLLLDHVRLDGIDDATLTQMVHMNVTVAAVDMDTIAVVALDIIVLIITVEAEEEM